MKEHYILKNITDLAIIGGIALKELMLDGVDWLDSRLADRWNGPGDES